MRRRTVIESRRRRGGCPGHGENVAQRSNHYEAAFEGFIRSMRVPCVAIDEAKRAICGEDGLKNPDFLLYPQFAVEPGGRGQGEAGRKKPGAAGPGKTG